METTTLIYFALAVPIILGFLPALPIMLPVFIPLVLIGIVLYYVRPDVLFMLYTESMMWWHGFKQKYHSVNGYNFSYAERGRARPNKMTMLYLHGFSAAKDMYLPLVNKIPKEWHVILLDLPGHGRTTRRMQDDFSYQAQADRVNQFVNATGLYKRPLHLIGLSMGGGVAGLYAAKYPNDLTKLTLICPSAIHTETLSDYRIAINERKLSTELPETEEAFQEVMPYLTYTIPKVPKQYWTGLALLRKRDNPFFRIVMNAMNSIGARDSLQENMSDIQVPTQVLWGTHDRLLHPSGAEILRKGLQNVDVHMLERCGHSVSIERPYKTAKLIVKFSETS